MSVIAVAAIGCASTAVPFDELTTVTSPDVVVDTAGLVAGARVGMAPWRACQVEVYAPDASVSAGAGSAVNDVFPRGRLSRLLVSSVLVDTERTTALVVDVTDEGGAAHRLAVKTGEPVDCLIPWDETLERLHRAVGTVVSFHPDNDGCTALALRGDHARALIDGSSPQREFDVTAITVNEEAGKATPWFRVGDLEVRHDVLERCFAPAASVATTNVSVPITIEKMAGAYPGTCHPGRDGGVECLSSVVVWQGRVRDDVVDLRRVRRTLGPVLMRDGAIAAAPLNERVVVNVTEVRNQRIATVRQGAIAALEDLATHPIAGVAIADATGGPGDLRVDVELRDLVLGRLSSGKQPATSEYILRYEDKYNPARDEAQAAVDKARSDRDVARSQYQTALTQYESTKKACGMVGKEATKLVGGVWGSILGAAGEAGCDIALAPSGDEVAKAEGAVSLAESTLQGTPRMINAPVMAPWNYEKTTYRRSVAVNVVLKIQDTRSGASETRNVPVEYVWEDFTVAPDATHNVSGREIAPALLTSADGLLPDLAAKVDTALRAAISQRIVEQAMPAARTALAGSFANVASDQLVDSGAYLAARDRLRTNLARGAATVSAGKPFMAVLGALTLPAKSCLMVVAVPADMSRQVIISSKGGAIADNRGVVPAYFETCGDSDGVTAIEITSDGDGAVRWGVYSTALFETTIAATAVPRE